MFIAFYLRGSITALNGTEHNYATITSLLYTPGTGRTLGENALSLGRVYNCLTTNNLTTFSVYNNKIYVQSSTGSAVITWKVTPNNGYFTLVGSGWYWIKDCI